MYGHAVINFPATAVLSTGVHAGAQVMSSPVTTDAPDPQDDPHLDKRLYIRIAAILRDRIASGELVSGTRMPGTRSIKAEFSTSMETAGKALRVLENDGIIRKWAGTGHWVLPLHKEDDD